MAMEVIAQRGPKVALVDLGDPRTDEIFEIRRGVVVDLRSGSVSRPANIGAIIARGYWTPFERDAAPYIALVRGAPSVLRG